MIYLLDANVLIDANRDYYPIDRIPEFWRWLEHHGTNGNVKIPLEVCEEVTNPADLARWMSDEGTKRALRLDAEADPTLVTRVVAEGYAADLREDELEQLGRDPFLISYALADPARYCVVTTERSKPSTRRANRKVPDVCTSLGITTLHTFGLTRVLDFRTNWAAP